MHPQRGFQIPVSSFNKRVLPEANGSFLFQLVFMTLLETLMHGGIA
jgi:hypothetical protein